MFLGHVKHAVAASNGLYVLFKHCKQSYVPSVGLYVPGGHGKQGLSYCFADHPIGHSMNLYFVGALYQ